MGEKGGNRKTTKMSKKEQAKVPGKSRNEGVRDPIENRILIMSNVLNNQGGRCGLRKSHWI